MLSAPLGEMIKLLVSNLLFKDWFDFLFIRGWINNNHKIYSIHMFSQAYIKMSHLKKYLPQKGGDQLNGIKWYS